MTWKEGVVKALAIINLAEGVIHLVVSIISFWGIYDTGAWDWRVCAAPATDMVLGACSLVTGVVLGKWQHSHHD